jgi:hypothetical protein
VVWLGIAGARVLAADDLLIGFLGRWWRIEVEVEGEFHTLAMVGIEGVVFENVVVGVEVV